jgi:hypothetical protein
VVWVPSKPVNHYTNIQALILEIYFESRKTRSVIK